MSLCTSDVSVRDLVPKKKKKKKVPKAVFICCIFFPFHNEQHYCFQLRRTKRKYLLLKTFFKNELTEKPVVLIQMNYTIIR